MCGFQAFGWIQEMYAFSLAAALVDETPIRFDLKFEFMLQPPWDSDLKVITLYSNGATP